MCLTKKLRHLQFNQTKEQNMMVIGMQENDMSNEEIRKKITKILGPTVIFGGFFRLT
jgi:hypothetical protein